MLRFGYDEERSLEAAVAVAAMKIESLAVEAVEVMVAGSLAVEEAMKIESRVVVAAAATCLACSWVEKA